MHFGKGDRTENNKVFMKFYTMHKSMMQRCYLKTSGSYKNYGAKGVFVNEEWHDLDRFFDTIEDVDGFDFERVMNGELQLDKDIKVKGNKEYSKHMCKFVTRSENSGNRPSNSREFVAVDPSYNYSYHTNREKFCRENGFNSFTVWNILQRGYGTYKKWQFFYAEDFLESKITKRKKFKATSPKGEVFIYESHAQFAREHNLSTPNISMVLSGKNKMHKGWTFEEVK